MSIKVTVSCSSGGVGQQNWTQINLSLLGGNHIEPLFTPTTWSSKLTMGNRQQNKTEKKATIKEKSLTISDGDNRGWATANDNKIV